VFYHENGFPISSHNDAQRSSRKSPYDYSFFIMRDDRERMYERIDERVDKMMEEGLFSEVKRLYDKGLRQNDNSMLALSYRQLMDVIEEKCSLEEAVERIKKETRHYAKRQVTWFSRQSPKDSIIIDAEHFSYDVEREADFILECIRKKEG
jgi:tRNA dimethylallyltransferase